MRFTRKQLGFKSVTSWSNGGGPDDFGWVIDGTNYTASNLAENPDWFPGNLAEVAAANGYGNDGSGFLQDHPELENT